MCKPAEFFSTYSHIISTFVFTTNHSSDIILKKELTGENMMKHNPIHISAYKSAGFIGEYQKLIKDTVIPYQYSVLCDEAQDTEKSHVIKNFINAGKALLGENTDDGFYGMVFQDSDAAKWLEAVGYSLAIYPDEDLEKTADELIDIIEKAQDSDGYLNTYYTIKDKDKRWTNILEGHELYCSGHMIEAAIAYYEATEGYAEKCTSHL